MPLLERDRHNGFVTEYEFDAVGDDAGCAIANAGLHHRADISPDGFNVEPVAALQEAQDRMIGHDRKTPCFFHAALPKEGRTVSGCVAAVEAFVSVVNDIADDSDERAEVFRIDEVQVRVRAVAELDEKAVGGLEAGKTLTKFVQWMIKGHG